MTARAPYTQAQIRRAIQAARKEGLPIAGVRPDGTVIIGEGGALSVQPDASEGQRQGQVRPWWEDMTQ